MFQSTGSREWNRAFYLLFFSVLIAALGLFPSLARTAEVAPTAALCSAASRGDLGSVKALLQKGADPNVTDSQGMTPLLYAAYRGDLAIVEVLLGGGASLAKADPLGVTPLHAAAFDGRIEVAKLLLSSGARVGAIDGAGFTPLHYAAAQRKLEVAKLLVSAGANVQAVSSKGATPLNLAEMAQAESLASYLRSVTPPANATPKRAPLTITDETLRQYRSGDDGIGFSAPGKSPGQPLSTDSAFSSGGTRRPPSAGTLDAASRAQLAAMLAGQKRRLLDDQASLREECERYQRFNDQLNNYRPIDPDLNDLADKYATGSPVRNWDGTIAEGSYEESRRKSRESVDRLKRDTSGACGQIRMIEEEIQRIDSELRRLY